MKKGPNPKLFLALAAGTFVAGAGLVFFEYSSMNEQAGKVASMKASVKETSEVQKQLDESKIKLVETAVKLDHLEKSVPDSAYIPTLLSELEKTGKSNGIEVTGVRPMPKQVASKREEGDSRPERKPYEELNIEVKGRGNYGDVMRFLAALQKFPKIVAARTVSIVPKTGQDVSPDTLEISIELRAFVFPERKDKKEEPTTARLEVPTREG